MLNKLEQLKTMTTVVADTGDINAIQKYQPEDATTNPSLLLKAASTPEYATLVKETLAQSKAASGDIADHADALAVKFGCEILKTIPGKISTEIDPRLSFDTTATVTKGLQLIERYQQAGIEADRVLLKIASTWEGIKAAEQLEKQGIHCNLTLLFSLTQAAAAADAGAFLISPFVGRILDWFKANTGTPSYPPHQDPGVLSVTDIYHYYKTHNYNTVVMGASFRNTGEIEALAGCDRLTISPALMDQLAADTDTLTRQLSAENARSEKPKQLFSESDFRLSFNEDAMATEKLAEGIRNFVADQIKLEQLIASLI